MEEKYRIRFFFAWGGEECFWSGNDKARIRFGYPINADDLLLTATTIERLHGLARWHNHALNWDYPPDPGLWRQDECDRFNAAVAAIGEIIRHELGDAYDLVNEYRVINEDPDLDAYLANPKAFRRQSTL